VVVVSLGFVLVLMDGRWNRAVIMPGKLSSAHAAILKDAKSGCDACHAAAEAITPHGWLAPIANPELGADPSRRCLACHFRNQVTADVMHAHSTGALKSDVRGETDSNLKLTRINWLARPPRDPIGPLACASCHQEHRGREYDARAMSNARCQACHQVRIQNFATQHPEFSASGGARTGLVFNHLKHRNYYPDNNLPCQRCHVSAGDEIKGLVPGLSYQELCSGCHQQGKNDWHGNEIARQQARILQPPEVELSDSVYWPVNAGSTLSPMMWMLLIGDDTALAALQDLYQYDDMQLDAEPFEWEPDDEAMKNAFADAVKRLLTELASGDAPALRQRVGLAMDLDPGASSVSFFLQQLLASQPAMRNYQRQFFPDLGRGADIAGAGKVLQPAATIRGIGWLVDTQEQAVAYAPNGHGDAFFRAWIELVTTAPNQVQDGFRAEIRETLKQAETGKGAALGKACLNCHKRVADLGAGVAGWTAGARYDAASAYPNFSHRTHLAMYNANGECTSCHVLADQAGQNVQGFAAHQLSECKGCHKQGKAPDSCLLCHDYHFVRP